MEEDSSNSRTLEAIVFRTIRDYVARNDPEGLQYIQSLEDNLGTDHESARAEEFDQYLKTLLSQDANLRDELKSSLGEDNQFINIVTGGHVEKIVNIARAGAVHIHRKSFLITHRSFVLLLTVVVLAVLISGGVYWRSLQPRILEGDFNIAVATFGTDAETSVPEISETVSQAIYQFIDQEFNSPQYNLKIDIEHRNIGVISGEDRAAELAESIHADIVIYGTVRVIQNNVIISPRFYIANSIKADAGELIGFHQLEMPQNLGIDDFNNLLIEGTEEQINLLQNSEILIYFTQGLTYLVLSDKEEVGRESFLRLALESIQNAIARSASLEKETGLQTGNDVLYLFASHISLLRGDQESAQNYIDETLSRNSCYGRSYIAQGNVLYDIGVSAHASGNSAFQDYFDRAIDSYDHALELDAGHADCEIQPYGYYLPAKAYSGLGNIYSFLFQVGPDAMNPALAEQALGRFEQVIAIHDNLPRDDPGRDLLRKLASNAHYQSGVIYLIQEKMDQAIERFRFVVELEDCSPLGQKARSQLERLGEAIPNSCGGAK